MSKNIYKIDSRKIKALLFDFDGTLVQTEIHQYAAYARFFKELGKDFYTLEEYVKEHGGQNMRAVYTQFMGPASDEVIEKARITRRKYYAENLEKHGVTSINGAVDIIHEAHLKKLKIAIVTGATRKTFKETFSRSDIPDIFHAVINAEDYTNPKPHPEPYLNAAKKLNVKPSECIIFEDALNGVKSAIEAGIDYFALTTNTPAQKFQQLDPDAKTIQDFTQIEIV